MFWANALGGGGSAPQVLSRTPTGASWADYLRAKHSAPSPQPMPGTMDFSMPPGEAPPAQQPSAPIGQLRDLDLRGAPLIQKFLKPLIPAAAQAASSFDEAGFAGAFPGTDVPMPRARPSAPQQPDARPSAPQEPEGYYGGSPENNALLRPLGSPASTTDSFDGFNGFLDRLSKHGSRSDAGLIPKFVHLLRG